MNIIPLLVLLSLALATCGVLLFLYSVRQGDHEHATRLSLLPLEDDLPATGDDDGTPCAQDPASRQP